MEERIPEVLVYRKSLCCNRPHQMRSHLPGSMEAAQNRAGSLISWWLHTNFEKTWHRVLGELMTPQTCPRLREPRHSGSLLSVLSLPLRPGVITQVSSESAAGQSRACKPWWGQRSILTQALSSGSFRTNRVVGYWHFAAHHPQDDGRN